MEYMSMHICIGNLSVKSEIMVVYFSTFSKFMISF